ncbi:MAG TPA: HAD family acid phosphatase [Bryobacteraceae bacterium]|nr:HAD family acid phosphatase [Bryobacteraceae bacterium]
MRLSFSLLVLCLPCLSQTLPDTHEKLIPTLWVQTSVEWTASTVQAYRAARLSLDRALKDKKSTAATEQTQPFAKLPPAIVLDIDETVLDNSPAQARQVATKTGFVVADWDQWVSEAVAHEIPGAAEFCRFAASKKVTVFYISNRDAKSEEATRRNLKQAGFPLHDSIDTVLLRGEKPEWTSEKTTRRKFVAAKYRVLLLVGDDLGDFLPDVRTSVEKRREISAPQAARWGRDWIMIPNPGYGSWESSLQEPERPAAALEQLWKKESWLRSK